MTPDQLSAIRARLDAATPGPWEARQWYGNDDGGWAAIGPHHESRDWNDDEPESDLHELAKRDAALIANAPTDLRTLLDEVERLNAECASAYRRGVEQAVCSVEGEATPSARRQADRLRAMLLADGECRDLVLEIKCEQAFARGARAMRQAAANALATQGNDHYGLTGASASRAVLAVPVPSPT
jgi:hypothetical protein